MKRKKKSYNKGKIKNIDHKNLFYVLSEYFGLRLYSKHCREII